MPWRFDGVAGQAALDGFAALLTAKPQLSERDDIVPFFHAHPHLAAVLASFNPNSVT